MSVNSFQNVFKEAHFSSPLQATVKYKLTRVTALSNTWYGRLTIDVVNDSAGQLGIVLMTRRRRVRVGRADLGNFKSCNARLLHRTRKVRGRTSSFVHVGIGSYRALYALRVDCESGVVLPKKGSRTMCGRERE